MAGVMAGTRWAFVQPHSLPTLSLHACGVLPLPPLSLVMPTLILPAPPWLRVCRSVVTVAGHLQLGQPPMLGGRPTPCKVVLAGRLMRAGSVYAQYLSEVLREQVRGAPLPCACRCSWRRQPVLETRPPGGRRAVHGVLPLSRAVLCKARMQRLRRRACMRGHWPGHALCPSALTQGTPAPQRSLLPLLFHPPAPPPPVPPSLQLPGVDIVALAVEPAEAAALMVSAQLAARQRVKGASPA
jgi:hypothetical protein